MTARYQVLSVENGPHINTLYDDNCCGFPSDIHNTLGSRTVGKYTVQEPSQQFFVLECSTLHMEHCGHGLSEADHYLLGLESDTQSHTGMLVHFVSKQSRQITVAALIW